MFNLYGDEPRGREIQWPAPWPYIGAGWYQDCRERGPADVLSRGARAAMRDLRETLIHEPNAYWYRPDAERELSSRFNISSATARQLMDSCPGSASPEWNVWCATAAVAGWPAFRASFEAPQPAA
jgi:hypothetical protein